MSEAQQNLAEHKAQKRETAINRFKIEMNSAFERLTESLKGVDELDSLFPPRRRAPNKKKVADGEEQGELASE